MDYNGKTPAELYAEEVTYFFDEKKRLQELVDTQRARRDEVLKVCTYDYPQKTLNMISQEAREAYTQLHSNEFVDKERMLVLLSPLYTEDTE